MEKRLTKPSEKSYNPKTGRPTSHSSLQFNLATMYDSGEGVPENDVEAVLLVMIIPPFSEGYPNLKRHVV